MTIHVATSDDLGRLVRAALREPVRFVPDNLMVGPAGAEVDAHVRSRADYWALKGAERAAFVRAARQVVEALGAGEQLVLWTSGRWTDVLMSWTLCAWGLNERVAGAAVHLVNVPVAAAPTLEGHQHLRTEPAGLRQSLKEAAPLSAATARTMAGLWGRLCETAPILAGAPADAGNQTVTSSRALETLAALGNYQAAFFPRLAGERLTLSRFDALLFSCIEEGGSTPVEVFTTRTPAGDELRRWLSFTGDVFLATRLAAWAAHGGADAALALEALEAANPMKTARYSLSEPGRALLRDGLADIHRGAPLPSWGATAYAAEDPWVVLETGEERSVRRLQAAVTALS